MPENMERINYVVLDEIALKLAEEKGETRLFKDYDEAVSFAESHVQGYQIIEIPFND